MMPEDIVVTAPKLYATPSCLLRLKGFETGARWDGKRISLLPKGTPALSAYPDSGKPPVWTIGWGATGPDIHEGITWTLDHCEIRFESDVMAREVVLRKNLKGSPTTQGQFNALLLLGYNSGKAINPATSALMRYHLAGQYAKAAAEFPRWCHDGGREVAGLVARRAVERDIYEGTVLA